MLKILTQGNALGEFISWAIESTGHAEGDNSMLVMWGHAYPFGVGFRDTGTGVDALDFAELSAVLKGIQDKLKDKLKYEFPDREMKLEILGLDAFAWQPLSWPSTSHLTPNISSRRRFRFHCQDGRTRRFLSS